MCFFSFKVIGRTSNCATKVFVEYVFFLIGFISSKFSQIKHFFIQHEMMLLKKDFKCIKDLYTFLPEVAAYVQSVMYTACSVIY